MTRKTIKSVPRIKFSGDQRQLLSDSVSVEQALTIKIAQEGTVDFQVVAITMHTPSEAISLATGYLVSLGVLIDEHDLVSSELSEDCNTCYLTLSPVSFQRVEVGIKAHLNLSSCGVCGTTNANRLEISPQQPLNQEKEWLKSETVVSITKKLSEYQAQFKVTGGLHGVAIFDVTTKLLSFAEDIGRHNAFDKAIGKLYSDKLLNTANENRLAVLSSRISFEMVQKAIMANINVLIAIGSPSQLAIQLAQAHQLTLIAFSRDNSFSIYHGEWRLIR